MSADRELAAQFRRGDEKAFQRIFDALYAPLCSYANGMLHAPDIAEELVQDVFVKLWQNHATLEIETSLTSYLYRAVRNRALNQLERRRTEQRWYQTAVLEAAARTQANAPSNTEQLDASQVNAELNREIERLPARCRQVIELRWRHGLKHAEIAETLGISLKGVENHLARGLQALRKHLLPRISP